MLTIEDTFCMSKTELSIVCSVSASILVAVCICSMLHTWHKWRIRMRQTPLSSNLLNDPGPSNVV